jgi:phosphomethylpyrimidine synthase
MAKWLRNRHEHRERRRYAAEQGVNEEEALQKGMAEKSREFVEKGSAIYVP